MIEDFTEFNPEKLSPQARELADEYRTVFDQAADIKDDPALDAMMNKVKQRLISLDQSHPDPSVNVMLRILSKFFALPDRPTFTDFTTELNQRIDKQQGGLETATDVRSVLEKAKRAELLQLVQDRLTQHLDGRSKIANRVANSWFLHFFPEEQGTTDENQFSSADVRKKLEEWARNGAGTTGQPLSESPLAFYNRLQRESGQPPINRIWVDSPAPRTRSDDAPPWKIQPPNESITPFGKQPPTEPEEPKQ
jgi:hypothetical protein